MTKKEHIEYWIKTSQDDWETVESLLNSKRYLHCLYFSHLVLEKICKAHWVNSNEGNSPPKIHNLVRLISMTNIELNENQIEFLQEFNDFQLEGRYPDYKFEINKICDYSFTNKILKNVIEIKECLIKQL